MAIERFTEFAPADRYIYDFHYCSYKRGWAQIDTRQDAFYYGTWTNPERREIFTYCEGDTTHVRCLTDDEYRQALREVIDWNKASGYWLGIDPDFADAMKQHVIRLGFAEDLH